MQKPHCETRPDIPEDLASIVDRALQPDPSDRFQTAADMGYALEYHLYHEGYGPTNVTLRDYLKEHFPSFVAHSLGEDDTVVRTDSASLIEHRANTMFGSRLEKEAPE